MGFSVNRTPWSQLNIQLNKFGDEPKTPNCSSELRSQAVLTSVTLDASLYCSCITQILSQDSARCNQNAIAIVSFLSKSLNPSQTPIQIQVPISNTQNQVPNPYPSQFPSPKSNPNHNFRPQVQLPIKIPTITQPSHWDISPGQSKMRGNKGDIFRVFANEMAP